MIPFAVAALLACASLAGPPGAFAPRDTDPAVRLRPAATPAAVATAARRAATRGGPPQASWSQEDRWFAQDKLLHFTASFGGFNLAYGALRTVQLGREPAMIGAAAVVGAAGLWKEWRDRRRGGPFSARDLAWDGLGILAGLAVAANTR